jgi:hypothetical protein
MQEAPLVAMGGAWDKDLRAHLVRSDPVAEKESSVRGPGPTAQGHPVDRPAALGQLRTSDPRTSPGALRERLQEDGYLYLRDCLAREAVLTARRELLSLMAEEGYLAAQTPPDDAIPGPKADRAVLNGIAQRSAALTSVLYEDRLPALCEALVGEPVRHFDFSWLRAYAPGPGTPPHMDSVFMNRGSQRLLTAWVPLGDVDLTLGGLAILENSHRLDHLITTYGAEDVDKYCSNRPGAEEAQRQNTLLWNGALPEDPISLREKYRRRWLTADFRAGDVVLFTMNTIHLGLDNNSDRIRLSVDCRYQPAAEPVDPRWIGENPSAHGTRSKVGVIC